MTHLALRSLRALLPLAGVSLFLLATIFVFAGRCLLFGRLRTPYIEQRPPSFLWKWFQEWWVWLWSPIERACVRLGVRPDAITVASTLIVGVAAFCMADGELSLGGWLYLFGASFDLVDGRVARATGRSSRAGAFLDSTLDRVAELVVFSALAIQFRDSPILYAALGAAASSVLVSYARARGEALGIRDEAKVGGMQRAERIVVTGLACALSPLADWIAGDTAGRTLIGAALTVLAALTSLTAARRGLAIYRALKAAEPELHAQASVPGVRFLRPGRRRGGGLR